MMATKYICSIEPIGEREKYISRIGYAYSKDGLNFERQREIAISPLEDYEKYGMEDPRLGTNR